MNKLIVENFRKSVGLGILHLAVVRKSRIWIKGERTKNLFNLFPEISNWQTWSGQESELWFLTEQDLLLIENPTADELWKIGRYCQASIVVTLGTQLDASLSDAALNEQELRSGLLSCKSWIAESNHIDSGSTEQLNLGGPLRRPGLFLDRDGVILKFVDYLKGPEEVQLEEGICSLIQRARQKSYAVVMVTNQSGLGRGLFTWRQYDVIQDRVFSLLAENKVYLDAAITAPFWAQSENLSPLVAPSFRKPRAGMVISAAKQLGIELQNSVFVGDSATDIEVADIAGFKSAYFFNSHLRVEQEVEKLKAWPLRSRSHWGEPVAIVKSLTEIEL